MQILAPGEAAVDLGITLDRGGGTIHGVVLGQSLSGPAPEPLPGVLVEAIARGHRVLARSDSRGVYVLSGVPAGDVVVRFATDDTRTQEGRYLAFYYPGVRALSEATRVPLAEGGDVALPQVVLRRGGVIGGWVRTADTGSAMAGLEIRVIEIGGAGETWTLRSRDNGRFLQGGVPPGTYTAFVSARGTDYLSEYLGGSRDLAGAGRVTLVAGGSQTDFILTPDRGGAIAGLVTHSSGDEPIPGAEVRVIDIESGTTVTGTTGEFGGYRVGGLASGRYHVYVPLIRRYFPSAINPADARAVTVTEPAEVGEVNLAGIPDGGCTIAPVGRGTITGLVRGNFTGVDRAVIRAWTDRDTVSTEVIGPESYALGCLREGTYTVELTPEGGLRHQYYRSANFPAGATPVVVTPGDTTTAIDFNLERGVRLEGVASERTTGALLADVWVRAVELGTRAFATTRTDADGRFVLDRLGDPTDPAPRPGLPAGTWRVEAESTLVADPVFTPVLPDSLGPDDGDPTGPNGDHDPAGGGAMPPGARLWAVPTPWNGHGGVVLHRDVPPRVALSISLVDAAGRIVAEVPWPMGSTEVRWDGRTAGGRTLSAGIYFLRPSGRGEAPGVLAVVR